MKQAIMVAAMCAIVVAAHAQTTRRQTPQPSPPAQNDDTAQNTQPDSTLSQPRGAKWGQFHAFHSFVPLGSR